VSFCCTCTQKGLLNIKIRHIYCLDGERPMQRNTYLSRRDDEEYSPKHHSDGCTCDECGEMFQKPLLATLISDNSNQKYYACPRCLTKVSDVKTREENKETSPKRNFEKAEVVFEKTVKCQHSLGYLEKRPKDTPIPDECLTCTKMVECLYPQ